MSQVWLNFKLDLCVISLDFLVTLFSFFLYWSVMPHSVELPFTIACELHTQGCTQVAQVVGVMGKMKEPINVHIYM